MTSAAFAHPPAPATPALDIAELTVDYASGPERVRAVSAVTLRVAPGELVALVGESGSGKSTIGRAAAGLLPATAHVRGGSVTVLGTSLTGRSERELRRLRGSRIGYVPQDPQVSLDPLHRVGDQIAEALLAHQRVDQAAVSGMVVELLAGAGIDRPRQRARQYPYELSGGMCQRVMLAIAWACKPGLVVADEPTSALDATVQKRILDHLDALREKHDTAVLLVTHDLAVALERADRVVVLRDGRTEEELTAGARAKDAARPYTRALFAATPRGTCRRPGPETAHDAPLVLEARKLVKRFDGEGRNEDLLAVNGVSLTLRRGRTYGLIGESGSGKSTTARMLARLVAPTSGDIFLDGNNITSLAGERLRLVRRQIQCVFQSPRAQLDPLSSVARIIDAPLRAFGVGDRSARNRRVAELLDVVRLPQALAWRRPGQLSGGQQQRVAIARALALRPSILILDEPVSALDVSVQAGILRLLDDLQREFALAYLFVSHDLRVIREICDDVSVMRNGEVIESGICEQVFSNPGHRYTMELIDSAPKTDF